MKRKNAGKTMELFMKLSRKKTVELFGTRYYKKKANKDNS